VDPVSHVNTFLVPPSDAFTTIQVESKKQQAIMDPSGDQSSSHRVASELFLRVSQTFSSLPGSSPWGPVEAEGVVDIGTSATMRTMMRVESGTEGRGPIITVPPFPSS
jgi:hypothetical protein